MDRCSRSAFNDDIGAWDTSGVTRMDSMFHAAPRPSTRTSARGTLPASQPRPSYNMFKDASAFNQDIGAWAHRRAADHHSRRPDGAPGLQPDAEA